jgi:hypothetical protein
MRALRGLFFCAAANFGILPKNGIAEIQEKINSRIDTGENHGRLTGF